MSSDEEQEYERFDVDNDFEGGEFVGGEFYYLNKRQKRQQTAEDRIYGIFAESGGTGQGLGFQTESSRAGLSAAAGGWAPAGKGPGSPIPLDQAGEVDGDDERPAHAGLGLGFNTGVSAGPPAFTSAGLGSVPGRALGAGLGAPMRDDDDNDSGDDDTNPAVLPQAFGRQLAAKAAARRRAAEDARRASADRAGPGPGSSAAGADRSTRDGPLAQHDMGAFEAHTKGVGAKLLAKMGWQAGKGLGRDGKGIAKPLEAQMRPKGMGMGYGRRPEPKLVQPEPQAEAAPQGGRGGGATSAETRTPAHEARAWKKKHASLRQRRTFRSAEELLAEQQQQQTGGGGARSGASIELGPAIIDMRGSAGPRVVKDLAGHLSGSAGAQAAATTNETDTGPLPELGHNLRLLVELAEAGLARADARLRHEQDTVTLLRDQVARLEEEGAEAERLTERLALLLDAGDRGARELSLPALAGLYEDLHAKHGQLYITQGMPAVAASQAVPLLTRQLAGWSPLREPARGAELLARWRPLLRISRAGLAAGRGTGVQSDDAIDSDEDAGSSVLLGSLADLSLAPDPWTRLLAELLLPGLRRDLTNAWDPKDPVPLEAFMGAFAGLLPRALVRHVMHALVLPALTRALAGWDPLRDSVPLHVWLFPWLPWLEPELRANWASVRQRFAAALASWHPADGSALALLAPWAPVWGAADWEALLRRCVLPRLAAALGAMPIDPSAQDLAAWGWTMAWCPVCPTGLLAETLETAFWPRWHAVLAHWLHENGDAAEIARWYAGWRAAIPDALLALPRTRDHLKAALDALQTHSAGGGAAGGGQYAPPAPQLPVSTPPPTRGQEPGRPLPVDKPTATGNAPRLGTPAGPTYDDLRAAEALSLRELVEAHAEARGVAFLPRPGRRHEGHQVFAYGAVSVLVDGVRSSLQAHMGAGRGWVPVSLQDLDAENDHRLAAGRGGK